MAKVPWAILAKHWKILYIGKISEKCTINTPEQFAEYADRSIEGITSLYPPFEEVLKEPDDVDNWKFTRDNRHSANP